MGHRHGADRIVYGGVTMVGGPVREDDVDDDTVVRARAAVPDPGERTASEHGADEHALRDRAADEHALRDRAADEHAARDRAADDRAADAVADTVLRPGPTAPTGSDDPLGDTVVRRPRHAATEAPTTTTGTADSRNAGRNPDTRGAARAPEARSADDASESRDAAADRAGAPAPSTAVTPPPAGPGLRDGGAPSLPSAPPSAAPPAPPADPPVRQRTPSIRVGGRIVRLDHPVVVGRRPSLPRVVRGPTPELLTVPSPSGQVSSSHLLVHAEGETAVVDDLRSTNGTVMRPPGSAPFRMPAGASIVVLTGTLVEIGDGIVIEVLSPHLRVGPDDGLPPFPPVP